MNNKFDDDSVNYHDTIGYKNDHGIIYVYSCMYIFIYVHTCIDRNMFMYIGKTIER
jgi:hypothetical protein